MAGEQKLNRLFARNRWFFSVMGITLIAISLITYIFGLGFPGFGWKKILLVLVGAALILVGSLKFFHGIRIWLADNRRRIIAISLQLIFLVTIFSGIELFARSSQEYLLWKMPIEKANVFWQLDKVKIWNRKFYESRDTYFRKWPIPIDFFDAPTQFPRYLFKQNTALIRQGNNALLTNPTDPQAFWRSNSWGLRGDEFSLEKPAEIVRIVCLGASTTEGSQGNRETYPYFLQQELTSRFPGRFFEVINAGHHGQGIEDLLEVFKQRLLPLNPDLVIFYEGYNDIDWNEFVKASANCKVGTCWLNSYPSWFKWLFTHSASFVFLTGKFSWDQQISPAAEHQFITANLKSPVHYRQILQAIVKEAQANQIKIALSSFISVAHLGLEVTYQQNSGIFGALNKQFFPLTVSEIEKIFQTFNQQSASVAREFSIPYADVAAQFPKELLYFPFDLIHLSPDANKLLAKLFVDSLVQQNVLEPVAAETEKAPLAFIP